uniref:NADH-ubiquinone oxidoreductase chain 2 n=1 Tax=Ventidius hungerfordi TaxID=3095941 RepID=A0AB38Z6Q2_9HEMI|nr:NADH dehydrogenase subunit 2 [Ventidius hungerfordi]WPW47113.1 NADH dehydrogenase subunit 2 [Ventidius hungerfordi]
MVKNSTKMIMYTTLIMSTIMVISSENWFSMWMGLEINMMSFIPLMEKKNNNLTSESKMIYFIIQSMSSILFMFMIIMNPSIMINEKMILDIPMTIISLSMIMKLGMAPVHPWFVSIMSKMNWENCMILMTWQKIAPLFVLSNTYNNTMIINLISLLSAMIGAIGGINQTSIKKIMAFSSINHLGWMVICMKNDNEMWMKYLIIYSIMIIMLTKMFSYKSINFINQINMNIKTKTEKMNILIMMLSLGGLPPFIGFLPKWMVIQSLILSKSMLLLMILMMLSMLTLFYYMRMIIPVIMSNNVINKWNIKSTNMKKMQIMMFLVNMMLPIVMMINMN